MDSVSGVGVLDKAFVLLDALVPRPLSLGEVVEATGIPRATAHRLLTALEAHAAVARNAQGEYILGLSMAALGNAATAQSDFVGHARLVATSLRDSTGESVQVYVPEIDGRRCVVSLESSHGLRWIVPEGSLFPLTKGSAGRVLAGAKLSGGKSATDGWIESAEEREKGVASVSAPVFGVRGEIVAAVSVSGPLERLTRQPGKKFGAQVARAARELSLLIG